jgi:hypothetical protein
MAIMGKKFQIIWEILGFSVKIARSKLDDNIG